ncbi:transcriptional repressor TraM [Agrobacterium fabrum]|uniref:transcriptional repressor TraM n=1 Tax=Agrobacterium fabrum TaxID=1176649 RepID=UPI0009BB276A|nr:transcriptional repressor TraM [Agrobacterium fabrum]
MASEDFSILDTFDLRPVIGLTRGLSKTELEVLTVDAVRLHRQLVERADQLFQALPDDFKTGKVAGGVQHLGYIEAMIEMHAQMGSLNMLIGVLGYIPKVSVN